MSRDRNNRICIVYCRRFPDTNFEHYTTSLEKYGFDITVIAYLGNGQKSFECRGSRKVYRLRKRGYSRFSHFLFTIQAIQLLRRKKPAIVHIHHTCKYFSLFKFLGPVHARYIFHSTSYPISSSKTEVLKNMLVQYIQCMFMDAVIIQSNELKDRLIGIRSMKRTHVVPVGFNKSMMKEISERDRRHLRVTLGLKQNQFIFVYCGLLSKSRNLDTLIPAFRDIVSANNEALLLFIGEGDDRNNLEAYTQSLGVSNKVIFLGRIPHEKVGDYIAASDVGISYIPINENYNYNPPLKTFEYMGCGIATIATRTVSNANIIDNGYNGLLVDDKSFSIKKAMEFLIKNDPVRNRIRNNARNSILQYDFSLITQNYLIPIYNNLMAQ